MVRRYCHIERKQSHLLRQEHSDLLALVTYFIRRFVHSQGRTIISLKRPDNNYVFSTGYAQMRPYVNGYFLLSLVQSDRFVKVVLDNCTGTSYPTINVNDLAEIEVAAPLDKNEAQKIGRIFRSIDHLITLHQRELEKLQNLKKSMLEKMFVSEKKEK